MDLTISGDAGCIVDIRVSTGAGLGWLGWLAGLAGWLAVDYLSNTLRTSLARG